MKKKRSLKIKYAVAAVVIFVLIILGNYIERTPLYERAIVLGVALDKSDKGISVHVQTVINGNNTTPGAASAYNVVEGEGASLSEALENIAKKAGLLPSFAHCELLIVGKEYLEEGFDECAVLMFENSLIQDNTKIIAVDGKASEVIKATVPISSTPSEYISNDLKLYADEGSACVVTLKDYVQRIPKGNGTRLLTVAKKTKANPPSTEQGEGSFHFFDLDNLAAFNEQGELRFYGKEISLARSLIEAKRDQSVSFNEGDKTLSATVLYSAKRTTFTKKPSISTNITYYVKIKEKQGFSDETAAKEYLEDSIKNTIENAFSVCAEDNVDLYSIKGLLNKRYGKAYSNVDLKDVKRELCVKVVIR